MSSPIKIKLTHYPKLPDGYLRDLASVDRFSIGIGGAMKAMLVLAAQEKLAADAQ